MSGWRSMEYPRDLSLEDARGTLSRKLCRDWLRGKSKKNDNDAIVRAINRMHFVVFERVSSGAVDKLRRSSFGILTDGDRAIATNKAFKKTDPDGHTEPPIYCIGCSEKIKSGVRGHRVTIKTRVSMLGFISETSDTISFGVKVSSKKNVRMHGIHIREDFIAFNLSSLSFDLKKIIMKEEADRQRRRLLFSSAAAAEPSAIPMDLDSECVGVGDDYNYSPASAEDGQDGVSEEYGAKEEEEREEDCGELSSHVYVFSWDPPTIDDFEFLTKEISLGKETMDRVKTLCSLSLESREGLVKPNDVPWKRERDRACMHMLVLCMCWAPDLIDWYVSAEDCMLREQLALLCDPSDMRKTFQAARMFLDRRNISFWNDGEKMIRDAQERRLRTAIEYASKTELPESIGELATQCVDYISHAVSEDS